MTLFAHISDVEWLGAFVVALLIWIGFNVHDINRKL